MARNLNRWAVVFESACPETERVESTHRTSEAACRACARNQRAFERSNPRSGGVTYLCGFRVADLADPEERWARGARS